MSMKVKDLISLLYKVDSEAEICFRPLSEDYYDIPINGVMEIRNYSVKQEGYHPIKTTVFITEAEEKELCEKT